MSQERRAQQRTTDVGDMSVTILSAPEEHDMENKTFACEAEDVSMGGVRFSAPSAPAVGSALEVQIIHLDVYSNRIFVHVGRVMWTKAANGGYSVGVKFTESPQETSALWEQVLEEKLGRLD